MKVLAGVLVTLGILVLLAFAGVWFIDLFEAMD